jgi:ribonuclease J
MSARIHRGAAEVGGSCVELESEGERLVLDLGRPLWAKADDEVTLPAIPGLLGDLGRRLAGS